MTSVARLLTPLVMIGLGTIARPDATVVTRAMSASTIAEVFVEDGGVRVVIEIGVADLGAFHNLLPDELREKLGHPAEPRGERLARFFTEDWTIRVDDGEPLPGRVTSMEGRRRLVRDEITGAPIPSQPDDAQIVIHAELTFPVEGRPRSLTLEPPTGSRASASASIGFVLYHEGLPVNDFRYLSGRETVELDWEDPWYSKFRNRNLWRKYQAPLSVFLYVEPYEVRKEIVVRPRDLQRWVDLDLEGKDSIHAGDWGALKQKVVDFLIARGPVRVDGKEIEPVLDRVHFIRRSLRTSRVLEEPQNLDVVSATLGVIITYPVDGLPQEVTMEWDLFLDEVDSIPCSATDEAGGLPSALTREDNVLRWQNFLLHPSRAKLVELDPPPVPGRLSVPIISVFLVLVAGVAALSMRKRPVGHMAGAACLLAAIAFWPLARVEARNPLVVSVALSEAQSASVCGDLLRNVYRAFDFREESDIYDVLAKSIRGELLTEVYLETRKALELEDQGGARARIQEVEVVHADTAAVNGGPGFTSLCTWNVVGSVGHWGHMHQRRNQYQAELTVEPVDGQWKITGLELQSEVRL